MTVTEGTYQRFKIDGQMHHWNDPHEGGTKYSSALQIRREAKTNVMNEARLRKMAKEMAEKAEMVSESSV